MSRFAAIALALLTCAACSGNGGSSGDATSPGVEASAGPSSTHTPAPSATQAALNPNANIQQAGCPVGALDAGAVDLTTKPGDFNADNDPDDLLAYRLGNDWHLRVDVTTGGGADVLVPGIDPAVSPLKALGGFNIGGGPNEEAFAITGAGAATSIIGIWKFDNCALHRVTLDGNPAEFPVGATVVNLSGLMCLEAGALSVTSAVHSGTDYTATRTDYDLVGTSLVARPPFPPSTFPDTDEAHIDFIEGLECGSMVL